MSFQIDTSFSVTEPTAAVGTDMFLVGGVMYYLALQADHLMVYTAPTKAGEEFVELFRTDLPVGFVPNEARIGDVLDGQFLISVYSNSGDYQAHFYEVKLLEFGGHTSELVATYVPSSASSTYRLKPARWSYGTKSTFLFVGSFSTNGSFAVFKGVDGVVQSGLGSTILSGSSLATLSVTDRGLQWWDEDEQVWYRASYSNSGNTSNDDAYLSTIDLQGVGSYLYGLHTNSVYDNAYRRDGKFYATQHTQSSTRLQEVSKTTIVESIPIGSDFGVSPYVFGSSKRPMNYGKPSGYMYSASSGGYGVWYNRGEYTTSAHPTPNLATTGFVRYTVSLREDTPELLPYSLSPYSKHAVRDTALFGDYGLSMGTGLGTKPSTTLSVGSVIGDKTQGFEPVDPNEPIVAEPKLYGRSSDRHQPYQPCSYFVSPELIYTSSHTSVIDDEGYENLTEYNGTIYKWEPEFLVAPAGSQTGQTAIRSSQSGHLPILYGDADSLVYSYNRSSGTASVRRYNHVTSSTTVLFSTPADSGGSGSYKYLQVGGQLNEDTASGVWVCGNYTGDSNFWVENAGDTLTPIASDDLHGKLSKSAIAVPVAGGHGDFLFSFRNGWNSGAYVGMIKVGTWLCVSLSKGQSWVEIEQADYNAADNTGRVTSAAMRGDTLFYTKYTSHTDVHLFKYDVANTQSIQLGSVPSTFHLPMTVYNNDLTALYGFHSSRTYYALTGDTYVTFPIELLSAQTSHLAAASYSGIAKACVNSKHGLVFCVGSTANASDGQAFAIPASRIPDFTTRLEGWLGSVAYGDRQWLPSEAPAWTPVEPVAPVFALQGFTETVTGSTAVITDSNTLGLREVDGVRSTAFSTGVATSSRTGATGTAKFTWPAGQSPIQPGVFDASNTCTISFWVRLDDDPAGAFGTVGYQDLIAVQLYNATQGVDILSVGINALDARTTYWTWAAGSGGGRILLPDHSAQTNDRKPNSVAAVGKWVFFCATNQPLHRKTIDNAEGYSSTSDHYWTNTGTNSPTNTDVVELIIGVDAKVSAERNVYLREVPISVSDLRIYNQSFNSADIQALYASYGDPNA